MEHQVFIKIKFLDYHSYPLVLKCSLTEEGMVTVDDGF